MIDEPAVVPGQIVVAAEALPPVAARRRRAALSVLNTSRWPVSITSHFHFFEVNRRLRFDRAQAFGMRLDVVAGDSVRWRPGELQVVELVEYGGARGVYGFNGLVDATLSDPHTVDALRAAALMRLRDAGYEDGDPTITQGSTAHHES